MKPFKTVFSSLLIAIAFFSAASASATTFKGKSIIGTSCVVEIDGQLGDKNLTVGTDFYTIATNGSTAVLNEKGEYAFDSMLIQKEGLATYGPFIGAPITIAGIGIIQWKGKLTKKGEELSLNAVGSGYGVWSWWVQPYGCYHLKPQ